MPVYLDRPLPGQLQNVWAGWPTGDHASTRNSLEIGIINNMPDGALQATERQFLTLLDRAAGRLPVRVSFYGLPEIPRLEPARQRVAGFYSRIEELWGRRLDGLIVTGTEPRLPNLADEPYWTSVTRVIDWAERNTTSSIWSCLAAHAAVLYMDGLERWRLGRKRFGLFPCVPACEHALTAGAPGRLTFAHSRWNELREKDLAEGGYRILTGSAEAGVDTFLKQRGSLFVLFQGHPEYEADTLLLEYRRDVGRYLRGEREHYPAMPANYFGSAAARTLLGFQERALRERRQEMLRDFPVHLVGPDVGNQWHPAATRIYGNWLTYLSAQKRRPLQRRAAGRAAPAETAPSSRISAGAN